MAKLKSPTLKLEIDPTMVMKLERSPVGTPPGTKNMVVVPQPAVIYIVRPGSVDVIWSDGDMKVSA